METVGSVCDKISIIEKRISVLERQKLFELAELEEDEMYLKKCDEYAAILSDLYLQRAYHIREIGNLLRDIFKEKRPAVFKSHKLYDKEVTIEKSDSLLETISLLAAQNSVQWELEDARRATDDVEEIAKIQQKIGESNKKRVEYIDLIDEIIAKSVKRIKISEYGDRFERGGGLKRKALIKKN